MMEARIVQSLLARNREEINCKEYDVRNSKIAFIGCKVAKDQGWADIFHGDFVKNKKQLAKLVEIQKALKEELRKTYSKEAEKRFYDSM